MWATVPGRDSTEQKTLRASIYVLACALVVHLHRRALVIHFTFVCKLCELVCCQLWWSDSSEYESRSRYRVFGDDEQGVVVGRRKRIGLEGKKNTDCSVTSFVTFLDLGSR